MGWFVVVVVVVNGFRTSRQDVSLSAPETARLLRWVVLLGARQS